MKQKKLFTTILAVLLLAVPIIVLGIQAENEEVRPENQNLPAKAKSLEISFDYQRQAGPGSNQYAVWVENEKGDVVKTLFVTSYTTKGRTRPGEKPMRGYVRRPACVPTWVKASNAEGQTDQQLDAVTGATPQADGTQVFTWDFTDQQGKAVPKGTYKVLIEATLFFDSDIIYTGIFSTKDKAGEIVLTPTLSKPDEQHKDMVKNVKAALR